MPLPAYIRPRLPFGLGSPQVWGLVRPLFNRFQAFSGFAGRFWGGGHLVIVY